ncbi:MAG: c-type cytochrome [Planctomycetaceae bacterium]|nr:c-type cytochrome [Planctomycetaceae bacterium]
MFICEPVHNLVSRVQVTRDGIPFSATRHPDEQESEFLSSTDQWFRPCRLTTGPDGSLWLCDMYRQVIEHPQWIPEAWQARLNLSAGSGRGRIYRVRRQESPHFPRPDLNQLDGTQLVQQLTESNGWRRDTAQRLLMERSRQLNDEDIQSIAEIARSHRSPVVQTQALWTLVALRPDVRRDPEFQAHFLNNPDTELVLQGLRVFGVAPRPLGDWQPEKLIEHVDVRVRYELALAAGDADDATARSKVLKQLAVQDAGHPWVRAAVLSSARQDGSDILKAVLASLPPSPDREALVDGLIATALGNEPRQGAAAVLTAISPIPGAEVADWQLAALANCLEALARRKQSLLTLRGLEDDAVRAVLPRVEAVMAAARAIAPDGAADLTVREAATRLLGRSPEQVNQDRSSLVELLNPQQPPELQTAAIERLAELRDAETLLTQLTRVAPRQQAAIESALLTRGDLIDELLAGVRNRKVEPQRLSAATRSALLNHRIPAIRDAAQACLGATSTPPAAEVTARLEAVSTIAGDVAHGQAVFEKRCSTCHRHNGIGVEVGPQLGALQNKSTEYLLTAILDANRSVEPKYRTCSILLLDGRQQTGLIAEETATSVTLMTADGRKHQVLREEIDELVLSSLSFMPDGLGKDLSDQDLADVILFVQQNE